jgi:hypothetical protein
MLDGATISVKVLQRNVPIGNQRLCDSTASQRSHFGP